VLRTDSDLERVFIDGCYVKAHQSSAGAAGGYDSQIIRDKGKVFGISVTIPRKKNSIKSNKGLDWLLYKFRHLVENAFARLKHYRAVAIQYDKLIRHYEHRVTGLRVSMATNVNCQQPLAKREYIAQWEGGKLLVNSTSFYFSVRQSL